ncbi:putative trehalose synthase [Clavibacter michiganensis]|nr:putative trehalose synthase [Clavibacter michiganensis]
MQEQVSGWGGDPLAGAERGSDSAPGQLRAEAQSRAHALAVLADAVAETHRGIATCRDDPSWSGRAHDAFVRALDDLAGRVALAGTLLHDAQRAAGSTPGCSGAHP